MDVETAPRGQTRTNGSDPNSQKPLRAGARPSSHRQGTPPRTELQTVTVLDGGIGTLEAALRSHPTQWRDRHSRRNLWRVFWGGFGTHPGTHARPAPNRRRVILGGLKVCVLHRSDGECGGERSGAPRTGCQQHGDQLSAAVPGGVVQRRPT